MSVQQADRIWRETMAQILQQVQSENTLNTQSLSKDQQGNVSRSQYQFYLKMYKNLNQVFECQVHPQKRLEVVKALSAVVGRLLECKMICAQASGTFTPDMYDICSDGTQLPDDLAITIPAYATERPNLYKRNELFQILIKQFDAFGYSGSMSDTTNTLQNYQKSSGLVKQQEVQQQQQDMTLEEAILLIQTAERGRNARLRYKLMKDIGKVKTETGMHRDVIQNREAAAIRLQKQWRVVLRTRQTDAKRQAELVFLGLASKSGLENKGRSIVPLVTNLLSADTLKHQRDVENEFASAIKETKMQLEKSLYSVIKGAQLEAIILPHQMQLALCPLSSPQDPTTSDCLESLYSLSRQIDKVHVMKVPELMKRATHVVDSGFPLATELLRQRVIAAAADFMQTNQYKQYLQLNKLKALQIANRDQMELDKPKLRNEVETDEAAELIIELRKRHYAAIRQYVDTTATFDVEEGKMDGKGLIYPKTPLQVETADEAAMMKAVYDEEEAIRKARGKKKRKAPKPPPPDETQFLSHYCVDLVESTVQYFNRWQRHADPDFEGQPYDASYVKEVFRNQAFRDAYVKVFAEVEAYLYEMQVLNKAQSAMDKAKGKYKRPKLPKKKKDKKKLGPLGPDPELGPVGDQTQETAFAELVKEGIIKLVKPAKMADVVASENFFVNAARNTSTFQSQAAVDMGLDPSKDANIVMDIAPLSLQAIKQNLVSDVILPLSTPIAREFVGRPQKLLLYGPPGAGKTLLVRAMATELGALFIDLSPANLIGKFPGSQVNYMFKLIKLVAFQNTPCIIYVDEAEIVFGVEKKKKKAKGKGKFDDGMTDGATMQALGYPKESPPEYNPARIKKEIVKFAKSVQQKDGIIIVGNATKTFNREKGLVDFFDRYMYVALPDYTQRIKLIGQFMTRFGLPQYALTGVAKDVKLTLPDERDADGLHGDNIDSALGLLGLDKGLQQQNSAKNQFFDIATLSRMLDGYSPGQIEEIISNVLGGNRLCNVNTRPLNLEEFAASIKELVPQFDSVHAHKILQQLHSGKIPPTLKEPEVKKK